MRPVSQSDVLPFERCPALWHATRVRGLDAGNRYSRIGTACHIACEALTRAVLGEDGRALYLVARDAVTAHAEAVDLQPDEMHEALDIMDSATAERSAISWWVPEGWTASAETELGLDAEFAPRHSDNGDVVYRGRLDRLQWNAATGELEIQDWKTSEDWMSGADVLLDVQARWYAMLALAWFPAAQVVTFRRVMLRLGYTASAKFVRGERWHSRTMDRARRLLSATNITMTGLRLANAEPGAFVLPERVGGWCGSCPVRGRCATFLETQMRGATIGPNVPRDEKARTLRALKAAAAELDAQLREDVSANGPIPLGDGTALGFFPKRALVLRGTRADALDELRAMGMDAHQEDAWFAPSERALPGLVRSAIDALGDELEMARGDRQAVEERLLAPATGFNFEVKEMEDA